MGFVWVLIPLAAILVGGFSEWLKFKEKQATLAQSLQTNNTELLEQLTEMAKQQERVLKRLENLETIVTSEEWDLREEHKVINRPILSIPEEPSNEEKVASIARRVRG